MEKSLENNTKSALDIKAALLEYKICALLNKNINGIVWENFREVGPGSIDWYFDKAMEYQFYNLAEAIESKREEMKNI